MVLELVTEQVFWCATETGSGVQMAFKLAALWDIAERMRALKEGD